jgi:hypothetical protein
VTGEWLPPQAPGSSPPPPLAPGTPAPPPPFEPADDDQPAAAQAPPPAPAAQGPPPAPAAAPPDERPNNEAVASIACGLTGFGLLIWTNGISTVVSLILGVFGVVFARNARRNVEEGRTSKHGDLAGGARIAGWITVGCSIAATIVWGLVLAVA